MHVINFFPYLLENSEKTFFVGYNHPWTEERKAAIAKVLTWDNTSSDESDLSEDENGLTFRKGYVVKRLMGENNFA